MATSMLLILLRPPCLTLANMRSATQLRCACVCGQILNRSKITQLEISKGYITLWLTESSGLREEIVPFLPERTYLLPLPHHFNVALKWEGPCNLKIRPQSQIYVEEVHSVHVA